MKDAFDELRELGVPLKAAEALRDDLLAMQAARESGSPAFVVHVSRGRVVGANSGRGRSVQAVVITDLSGRGQV